MSAADVVDAHPIEEETEVSDGEADAARRARSPRRKGERMRYRILGLLAAVTLALLAAGGGTAATQTSCGGTMADPGVLGSGTYGAVTVDGFCVVPPGATITIRSGLTVAPGGFLVASGAFDENGPVCDRSIEVAGGIEVGEGATLILGDGPGSGCSTNTHTVVGGGLKAHDALNVIVHGVVLNGGISSVGGGDGLPCNFAGFPTYSTVEDSLVNGGVSVAGYHACWLGFARNSVNGGVSLMNNTLDDPDAMEILANHINGGLACEGNTAGGVPRATNYADEEGGPVLEPNSVTGAETGQCAGL